MYFLNAASPSAMSAIAPEGFSISASCDECRSTLSRSKRSTCLISLTTLISVRRSALGQPAITAGDHDQDRKADQQFADRRLHRPRNSDSGTTVTSDHRKRNGVSTVVVLPSGSRGCETPRLSCRSRCGLRIASTATGNSGWLVFSAFSCPRPDRCAIAVPLR